MRQLLLMIRIKFAICNNISCSLFTHRPLKKFLLQFMLSQKRIYAQLIWFRRGYLEYRFPNRVPRGSLIRNLELSMEICSEAPLHNPDWPSDITLWINGKEVGTWTSPGDFGGERGLLTPQWWGSENTQYGLLKTWRVHTDGSYIDGRRISQLTVDELELDDKP